MNLRILVSCAVAALMISRGVQAQSEHDDSRSSSASGFGRYLVTLQLLPGDDLEVVARQLAATYRGRIEPYATDGLVGFAVFMSDTAARLLSDDPRVARVEELSELGSTDRPAPVLSPSQLRALVPGTNAAGPDYVLGPYKYDGAGNIVSGGAATSFVYDAFGRITSGTVATGRTESYQYDDFGNVHLITTDGQSKALGVDQATNRLTATVNKNGVTANHQGRYDNSGNMVELTGFGTFKYDAAGTVIESTAGTVTRQYLYTADDERIAVYTPARGSLPEKWEFTVRGLDHKVLRRITKNGLKWFWEQDYIYRDGALLASETAGPEKTLHFHLDHLGTPRLITGRGGAEVSRHTYFPFGLDTEVWTRSTERMQFTGHERDDSGLDYMHARYYAPGAGRFLSVDPGKDWDAAKSQSWNLYSYVRNNPVNASDPDGQQTVSGSGQPGEKTECEGARCGTVAPRWPTEEEEQRWKAKLAVTKATATLLLVALEVRSRGKSGATAPAAKGAIVAIMRSAGAGEDAGVAALRGLDAFSNGVWGGQPVRLFGITPVRAAAALLGVGLGVTDNSYAAAILDEPHAVFDPLGGAEPPRYDFVDPDDTCGPLPHLSNNPVLNLTPRSEIPRLVRP